MNFKSAFLIITVLIIVISCNRKRTRIITPSPPGGVLQGTAQVPEKRLVTYQISERMQKVKNGEWRREDKLNVLCGTGTVTCSNGGQALCYTGVQDVDLIVDEFADIAENSIPVCVIGTTVTYLIPGCAGGISPVCGLSVNVQETITSKPVVCDSEDNPQIVCPFGGTPKCVQDSRLILNDAYCVNDQKIIISGRPKSGDSLYIIACKDESETPECFF